MNMEVYEFYWCTLLKERTSHIFFERQVISDQSWNNIKLDFLHNLSNVPVQGQIIKVTQIELGLLCCPEERDM